MCDPILKVLSQAITEHALADDVSDIILQSKPLGLCIVLSACNVAYVKSLAFTLDMCLIMLLLVNRVV